MSPLDVPRRTNPHPFHVLPNTFNINMTEQEQAKLDDILQNNSIVLSIKLSGEKGGSAETASGSTRQGNKGQHEGLHGIRKRERAFA